MHSSKLVGLCALAALALGCGGEDDTTLEPAASLENKSSLTIRIVDLGVAGQAQDINAEGRVTGFSEGGPDGGRAFTWYRGQLTWLDARGSDTKGFAINAAGRVAGHRGTDSRAVVWHDGTVTDLGTLPGGEYSLAHGINADGQVVGFSGHPDGIDHGFLWEEGVMTDLGGLPDFPGSNAFDINQATQIVGNVTDGDITLAALWKNGIVRSLGTLTGGERSSALAIDRLGRVVGWSESAGGNLRAFLWKRGVMTDLGTLPGGLESQAWDINAAGQIVGHSTTASGNTHAFRWQNGVMTDLGTLPGGTVSVAYGINRRGDVVGYSGTADPEVFHAVLWRIR